VYLGGAPPNLPSTATLVSTPLQPNRWRNDVANGTNSYAWWQFNPLSMDIEVCACVREWGLFVCLFVCLFLFVPYFTHPLSLSAPCYTCPNTNEVL
jgi:hypothetical protein